MFSCYILNFDITSVLLGIFAADLLEARILEGEVSVPENVGGKYDENKDDDEETEGIFEKQVEGAMKSVRASYVRLAVREGKYRMVVRDYLYGWWI